MSQLKSHGMQEVLTRYLVCGIPQEQVNYTHVSFGCKIDMHYPLYNYIFIYADLGL